MRQIIVGISLSALAVCTALAQTAAPLAFEVASVKPSPPSVDDRVMRRMAGGPGSNDPGTLTYNNVTLKLLLMRAYDLKEYQVEGPDWITEKGYDITAKLAPGTTMAQYRQMLQTLLAERFKVAVHRETKQLPVYALIVAKGGPRVKETDSSLPPRADGGPGIRMMATPGGRRLSGAMTMTQLANALTNQMDRAVLDQTELNATYDVDLSWTPDEMDRNTARLAVAGGGPGGPGGPGGEGGRMAGDAGMSLTQAVQERLGLKLEARKSSAEILVVDKAEQVPVEN